jgi:hypothetical protein
VISVLDDGPVFSAHSRIERPPPLPSRRQSTALLCLLLPGADVRSAPDRRADFPSIVWSGFQRRAERAHRSSQVDHQEQRVGPVKKPNFSKFRGARDRGSGAVRSG